MAATDHGARPQVLRKSTLVALSRAIEHELLARAAAPVLFGAFQRERFYRALEPRYRRLARNADAATVFADFADAAPPLGRAGRGADRRGRRRSANEWAVIVDAPGYAACLLAWEQPGAIEPGGPTTSIAASRRSGPSIRARPGARRRRPRGWRATPTPAYGRRLEELLADRPLALEQPAPALTALTNRLLAYVEAATRHLDQLDDDLVARQRGALAGGHDREAVGAEHRGELVRALRAGRRRQAVAQPARARTRRDRGGAGSPRPSAATIRSGSWGAPCMRRRARAARRA